MELTLSQQTALAVLPKVFGSLSFCFSWVIIVAVLRDGKGKRSKVYHRLVLGMSCADVSSSFALALSTWPIPSSTGILWAVGNTQTCTAQGFFTQFGISSPLYNVSLSLYYLLAVRYGWREHELRRVEPYLHLLPFSWAILTGVAGLPLQIFNSANLWCWIGNGPEGSGRNENTDPYRWAFFYGPLWTAIIVVTINLILLFSYVRTVTLRSERYAHMMQIRPPHITTINIARGIQLSNKNNGPSTSDAAGNNDDAVVAARNDFEKTIQESDDAVYYDQGYSSTNVMSTEHGNSSRGDNGVFDANDESQSQLQGDSEQPTLPVQDSTSTKHGSTPSKLMTTPEKRPLPGSHKISSLFNLRPIPGRSSRMSDATSAINNTTATVNKATQFLRRRRQVANQCFRYALAFYWTWIPITVVRILQTINRPPVFALFVLAAMNTPTQGLPNFLVYLYPLVMKAREQTKLNQERDGDKHPNIQSNNLFAWIRISLSPSSQPAARKSLHNSNDPQSGSALASLE